MNKKYNGELDFWKFAFCLAILFFHIGETFAGKNYFMKSGKFAVEMFFIVSGYFMCISAKKAEEKYSDISLGRETAGFIISKVKRILPVYLYCYAVGVVVWFFKTGVGIYDHGGLAKLFLAVVKMLPNFLLISMSGIGGTQVMGLTWYISAMLIAMLAVYPLLRKYKDSYTMIIAPLMALLIAGYFYKVAGYKGFKSMDGIICHGILRALIGINIGCVVYVLTEHMKQIDYSKAKKVWLAVGELISYAIVFYLLSGNDGKCVYYTNLLLIPAIAIAASKQSAISTLFDNKLSKFLGSMSLYIYLCQSPGRILIKYLYPKISYRQGVLYVVSLTLALALVGMAVVKIATQINNLNKEKAAV